MRGAALAKYAEVATALGLNPDATLRELGIDPRVLTQPELRLPGQKVLELLAHSAAVTGCETFGLRMALERRLSDYGPVSLMLAHQATLRDALMVLVRYQRMLNECLFIYVEDQDADSTLVREELITGGEHVDPRQAYELALGTLAHIFRAPASPAFRPARVQFAHSAPRDPSLHIEMFGPDVVFDSQVNALVCRRAELDAAIPGADPALATHAESFIRSLPFADETPLTIQVVKAIHALLPFDGASVESVSARLGLSARTLQRRLAEEGADFSSLLNEARRAHAFRHLSNSRLPLDQVAGLVGYRYETSFARWFIAEVGVTNSAWRTGAR